MSRDHDKWDKFNHNLVRVLRLVGWRAGVVEYGDGLATTKQVFVVTPYGDRFFLTASLDARPGVTEYELSTLGEDRKPGFFERLFGGGKQRSRME